MFVYRVSKALSGELFSTDEVRRMEGVMRAAMAEANQQWAVAIAKGLSPSFVAGAAIVDSKTTEVLACAADSLENPLGHAVMVWVML